MNTQRLTMALSRKMLLLAGVVALALAGSITCKRSDWSKHKDGAAVMEVEKQKKEKKIPIATAVPVIVQREKPPEEGNVSTPTGENRGAGYGKRFTGKIPYEETEAEKRLKKWEQSR